MLWRGLAVIASWILWPILFFSGYWLVNVLLGTGRRCSIEGCDSPDGSLWYVYVAAVLGPPLYLTRWWWRRRTAGPAG